MSAIEMRGEVIFIDHEHGYGYLHSNGKRVGFSRKFIGKDVFDKLAPGQKVNFIPNGRGSAENISIAK